MRRFLVRLVLFTLPFALGFLLLTGMLVYSGESMPLSWVARMQMNGEVLYRPRYGNRDLAFKTLSANLRAADVLAIGSSHVLQLRAALFNRNPAAFYNAGAPGWRMDQIEALLYSLNAEAYPRVLLLGIDHPWFNDAYTGETIPENSTDFDQLFAVNRAYMQSAVRSDALAPAQAVSRAQPDGTPALGLRAIRDGHGFRSDGSEQYGDFLVGRFLDPATERQRHLDFLRDGREMYVPGNLISESALAQLERILAWCSARGIQVVGFLPPFAPTQYAAMVQGGRHAYALALPDALAPLFTRYGGVLYDFSDGAAFGTDSDFFDGWHGSERIFLRLYVDMLERAPETFSPYSDADALRAIDQAAGDTFRVFGG